MHVSLTNLFADKHHVAIVHHIQCPAELIIRANLFALSDNIVVHHIYTGRLNHDLSVLTI